MKKQSVKEYFTIKAAVILFLLFTNSFAQDTPQVLVLGTPVNSQITDNKPKRFTIELKANQTARVEVEYQGFEVVVTAYNPQGEPFIRVLSPSGVIGRRTLFLTAETAGVYAVEVSVGQPVPVSFKIEVAEIRPTTDEDKKTNELRARIYQLILAAPGNPGVKQTVAEQREKIEFRRELIRLSKLINDRFLEARSYIIIGARFQSLGETQNALNVWLKAYEIYRELKRPELEAYPVITIGSIYLTIGEYDKAIEYITEAERLFQANPSPLIKSSIYGLFASAYYPKGEYQKAIDYANKALKLYSDANLKFGEVTMHGLLGTIYQHAGQTASAIENIEKALADAGGFEESQAIADLHIRLGILYRETGKLKEANERLTLGKEMAERVGQTHLVIQSLYYLAAVENDLGNAEKAIETLEKNIAAIEKIRTDLQDKSQRAAYFSTVQDSYELYTDLLIGRSDKGKNLKDVALAFEMSERSRSRSLIDLLQEANVDLSRENSLSNETISAADVQKLLDEKTVLIEYKLGEKRSFAWFVTNNSIEYFEFPNRQKIEEKALAFYNSIISKDKNEQAKTNELSKDLSEILLSPVAAKILNKRIAIVADGVLQYTPFSALVSPKSKVQSPNSELLIQTNEIVILPSASVLAQLRTNDSKPSDKTIAIFADPVFDSEDSRIAKNSESTIKNESIAGVLRDFQFGENLPRLLASRQEAKNIANLVDRTEAKVNTDFAASVRNIKAENLENFKILHFATHGLLNSSRPELSGLVFSLYDEKGEKQDGFLGLSDIYNLDLASDLVVLSACQTALGKDVRGEGLIGLSRGFLYAGSKRIMASLWKVDDAATAEFMKRFYTNHLQKGLSATESLRQTKIEMQKIPRYKSPYYWSAFTLLGDWK